MRYAISLLVLFAAMIAGCSGMAAKRPAVVVTARYPGASAQVIADTVAAPIEQQINGVEWMLRLESESRNDGTYTACVRFKPSADPKIVLTLVKNRLALAKLMLPDAVQHAGVIVETKATEKPGNRVTIALLDRGQVGWDALHRFSEAVLNRLSAEGAIVSPETFPGPEEKQPHVQIDRARCREYNVPVSEVIRIVDAHRGMNTDQLKSLNVGSANGETVVLGKLVTIELASGLTAVYRVDMYPAVRISGSPPQGKTAESAASRCAQIADAVRNTQDYPGGFTVMGGF
jgi:multidrug efflux pump subunit AcrB